MASDAPLPKPQVQINGTAGEPTTDQVIAALREAARKARECRERVDANAHTPAEGVRLIKADSVAIRRLRALRDLAEEGDPSRTPAPAG
jgi:hypothetical protein